jgi:hypothetical protein
LIKEGKIFLIFFDNDSNLKNQFRSQALLKDETKTNKENFLDFAQDNFLNDLKQTKEISVFLLILNF